MVARGGALVGVSRPPGERGGGGGLLASVVRRERVRAAQRRPGRHLPGSGAGAPATLSFYPCWWADPLPMVRRGPSRSDRYEHQQRNVPWQQPPPRVGKARSTTARARCPPPPASRAASPRHLVSLTARARERKSTRRHSSH